MNSTGIANEQLMHIKGIANAQKELQAFPKPNRNSYQALLGPMRIFLGWFNALLRFSLQGFLQEQRRKGCILEISSHFYKDF